jgi:hypothetical protein
MAIRLPIFASLLAVSAVLAGCADTPTLLGNNAANLTTASVSPSTAPKIDPACSGLSTQIESLRKEGIADKVEKASLKKYKLTTAELVKADQLNKANADFQGKCGTVKAAATPAATPVTAASVASTAAAVKSAAPAVANIAAGGKAPTAATAAAAVASQY